MHLQLEPIFQERPNHQLALRHIQLAKCGHIRVGNLRHDVVLVRLRPFRQSGYQFRTFEVIRKVDNPLQRQIPD
jgi:hypothetical protein